MMKGRRRRLLVTFCIVSSPLATQFVVVDERREPLSQSPAAAIQSVNIDHVATNTPLDYHQRRLHSSISRRLTGLQTSSAFLRKRGHTDTQEWSEPWSASKQYRVCTVKAIIGIIR